MQSISLNASDQDLKAALAVTSAVSLADMRLVQAEVVNTMPDWSPSHATQLRVDVDPTESSFAVIGERRLAVRVGLCVKIVPAEGPANRPQGAVVKVVYVAEYLLPKPPIPPQVEKEGFAAFARTNAVFNCWPYLREEIQHLTTAMGMPVIIPLLKVNIGESPAPRPMSAENEVVTAK